MKYLFPFIVVVLFYLLISYVEFAFNPANWQLLNTGVGRFCSIFIFLLLLVIAVWAWALPAVMAKRKLLKEKKTEAVKEFGKMIEDLKKNREGATAEK